MTLFFISPKLGIIQKEDFAVAAGTMIIGIPEEDATQGIIYGASTWGTRDTSLTAGVGWGWVHDEGHWEIMDEPAIMVGGEHRLSNGVKLLTENWLFPYEDAVENILFCHLESILWRTPRR